MKTLRHILELFQLTLPFQLSTPHCILCHLPDKALFESEEAPVFGACLVTAIQPDEQEIGQNGQCNRASHPLALLRDLHLHQVQPAFEFLKRDLNGMITNDKFCCTRWSQLQLSWWRRPLRLRQESDPGRLS